MNAIALVQNELYLSWCEHRRQWGQSLVAKVIVSCLFLGLYYGIRAASASSSSLDGLIVGYMTWGVAGATYNSVSHHVTSEAHAGTLEQLHLTPYGFRAVLLSRAAVHLGSGILNTLILTGAAMVLTRRWISMPLGEFIALLALAAPSLVGVGLAIGGAAMAHKRMQTVAVFLNLFLIAVISVPAHPWNGFALLPFSYAASLIRSIAGQHTPATPVEYAAVAVNSMVYLVLGTLAYSVFERRAKRTGIIGQY